MIYTITDGGIVYSIAAQDTMIEERETDRIADEQQQVIPDDEAVATMREISDWIERIG